MDTPPANFTPEQWKIVNELLTTFKNDVVYTVNQTVVEVIKANQDQVLESVRTQITEAINANQRVILATNQTGSAGKNEETRKWKVFMVALPIILSTILGAMIWHTQTRIQNDISNSSETLKSRLATGSALTQEFYKKRLDIYDKTHKEMALLVDAFQSVRINPESFGIASDSLKSLNQTYRINNLYVSNEVAKELQKLWRLGIDMPSLRPTGKTTMTAILTQISEVEEHMKKDLGVEDLGRIDKIVTSNSNQ